MRDCHADVVKRTKDLLECPDQVSLGPALLPEWAMVLSGVPPTVVVPVVIFSL